MNVTQAAAVLGVSSRMVYDLAAPVLATWVRIQCRTSLDCADLSNIFPTSPGPARQDWSQRKTPVPP